METKTYPLYTLEFPASEEKSKNEPKYFQIVRWDNRTKLQKEVDRRTYFYFIGSSGVHLKDVLTDVLKFNEKAHDVPEEYLLEKLKIERAKLSNASTLEEVMNEACELVDLLKKANSLSNELAEKLKSLKINIEV